MCLNQFARMYRACFWMKFSLVCNKAAVEPVTSLSVRPSVPSCCVKPALTPVLCVIERTANTFLGGSVFLLH